jgi:hypothetical protein
MVPQVFNFAKMLGAAQICVRRSWRRAGLAKVERAQSSATKVWND